MNKKLGYFSSIKFLSPYIMKYKKRFIFFYIGRFIDMLLSIAMPIVFGVMVNEVVYYQNLSAFLHISLVFIVIALFDALTMWLVYTQDSFIKTMYIFEIRQDIYQHMLKADPEFLSNSSSGDIITSIQWYSFECAHFVIRNIIHLINNILTVIITVIYLFIISPPVGIFVVIAAPFSVFINTKFGGKIRKLGDKNREYYGAYIGWLYEILSALRDIRMLDATKKVGRTFTKYQKSIFNVNIDSSVQSMTASNLMKLVTLVIQLAIYTFAGYLALHNNITIGVLIVILAFYSQITSATSILSGSYLDAQNRVSYIQHICDYMNSPTEESWCGKNELKVTHGIIKLNNVSFSYQNSNQILNDLSLEISPSNRLAIVGKSGCGKTTLAYMLIGFYAPQSGNIEVDGQKLTDCTLKSIRENIGLIQQDILLFDGTIRENLMLGGKHSDDSDIKNALEQAGILTFINELPDGINTVIGKDGIGLSGGQKQRLAIARIYLKNPKIIIFDEATSSLDSETEGQIHEAWQKVLSGRTSIVIAHRESSVMLCENVAIIEDGKIIETGAPKVLRENSEAYKTLFAVKEGNINA